ncbi:unnamed protein product [Strongylus vulgaris]|uniref:Uncharacterized protein n=1 Tax=Strongylus vulgaris TaxID=40348 RepID=A0A3P7J300_STRVU|nr:unnamed protein product [Strongylus vulgaris]
MALLVLVKSYGVVDTTSTAAVMSAVEVAVLVPSVTVPLWGGRSLLSISLELTSCDNRRNSNASNGLRCQRNVYIDVFTT